MATSINTYSSWDYDTILQNLILFMRTQDEFKDLDFEGSGIRALLRVMAYNAMQYAFQNNMAFNELDFSSAQIRENVSSQASGVLGYLPSSKKAARLEVQVIVTPNDLGTAPSSLTMKKDVRFFANKDGIVLMFSPSDEYTVNLENGVYTFNVVLLQGVWNYTSHIVQTQYGLESYEIPETNIDIDTLNVIVKTSPNVLTYESYSKFDDIFDIGINSNIYFIKENRKGLYEIEFGDGHIAKKLDYGNVVLMEYLITDGEIGNDVFSVTPASGVSGYYNVQVLNVNNTKSYNGSEKEDIFSIKKLAPYVSASSGRAVIDTDFVALTKKLFPEAKDVIAWGGEKEVIPRYGYMFVSVIPTHSELLSSSQKTDLEGMLTKRCVGSITPIIKDPEYIYLNVTTTVKYNPKEVLLTTQSMKNKVINFVKAYSQNKLELFGGEFIHSDLITYINNIDKSIKGNITEIVYEKRFTPVLNVGNRIVLYFGKSLDTGNVKIDGFSVSDSDFIGYTYYIVDSSGVLKLYKTNGVNTVLMNSNIGSVDYTNGVVELINFRPNHITNGSYCTAIAFSQTNDSSLMPFRNTILKINKINVNLQEKVI